jgi:hypothetical protein
MLACFVNASVRFGFNAASQKRKARSMAGPASTPVRTGRQYLYMSDLNGPCCGTPM